MLRSTRSAGAWIVLLACALPSLACSSLTRPDDVSISAEPLPARPAAPGAEGIAKAPAEKPARAMVRAPQGAPPGGGACGN